MWSICLNSSMQSSLAPWPKVGKNLFTPPSTGKYITYSALNKANQEHAAPQKSSLRLGPTCHKDIFSSTHPCKIPPAFICVAQHFLRIECTPRNWFPNCKIANTNTAKYILLVLAEMAEDTFLGSNLFLHTENVQSKNKRLLKVCSAKFSFYRPSKNRNAKIIALCSNQFIQFNFYRTTCLITSFKSSIISSI